MKRQEKTSEKVNFSLSVLRRLRSAYRGLERAVGEQPWLVQGSVNVVAPKSPGGNVTYTWTRKVRAKTVTVALSKKQAIAFRRAIAANRQVEDALARLREVGQTALLTNLPGVPKRRANGAGKTDKKNVPHGP